jgi:hypothetical protein
MTRSGVPAARDGTGSNTTRYQGPISESLSWGLTTLFIIRGGANSHQPHSDSTWCFIS